jgi:hypothetical protein
MEVEACALSHYLEFYQRQHGNEAEEDGCLRWSQIPTENLTVDEIERFCGYLVEAVATEATALAYMTCIIKAFTLRDQNVVVPDDKWRKLRQFGLPLHRHFL